MSTVIWISYWYYGIKLENRKPLGAKCNSFHTMGNLANTSIKHEILGINTTTNIRGCLLSFNIPNMKMKLWKSNVNGLCRIKGTETNKTRFANVERLHWLKVHVIEKFYLIISLPEYSLGCLAFNFAVWRTVRNKSR